MKVKRWNILGNDIEDVDVLVKHGFSPLVAGVLCSRGFKTPELAEQFLKCGTESLYDPFLIKDMDRAVARLRRAIEDGEKVAVYGDYDVDGVTSTCLMYQYLGSKGISCIVHIPDRLDEGYGVNEPAIRRLAAEGATLLVTVDCGITAAKETALAKTLGLDIIITDHHECSGELPEAEAVVDPRRPDCGYPFPYLAGVGVAFKLVSAMEGREETQRLLETYGDLVALGTLADVMPVMDENRTLIRAGMDIIRSGKRDGLVSLVEASGGDIKKLAPDKIGYTIAPRLNAAGRMGKAKSAFLLLAAEGRERADAIAQELCDLNRDRQQLEAGILADALSMLKDQPAGLPVILGSDAWHQGVAGIVASRISERFFVPAIIVCFDGEEGHGSCRSFGGFDLFSALDASKELLVGFGGHMLAAGLTVKRESFDEFRESFCRYYQRNTDSSFVPTMDIDFEIDEAGLLSSRNVEELSVLEPWGNGNPQPLFCIRDAVIEQLTLIGEGKHIKMRTSKNGVSLDCVFFAKTLYDLALKQGDRADLAFFPQINEFRGNRGVQLLLREVKPSEEHIRQRDAEMELLGRFDGQLTKEEKKQFLPERRNFVDVWHTIERLSEKLSRFGGELRFIVYGIGAMLPTTPVPKIYACLRVFAEMGLISMMQSGADIDIAVHSGNNRRADLNASKLLKRLRS